MFSTKTIRDVGMVPTIKWLHGKTNRWKGIGKGEVCHDNLTTQVDICQFQGILDTRFS